MWTHQFIIKKYRVLHGFCLFIFIQRVFMCTLPSYCIQFTLISYNQNNIISSILVLYFDRVNLIIFNVFAFTNLNFNNFFHLFLRVICLFDLLS